MTGTFFRRHALPWLTAGLLFMADLSLYAQGTRPGSAPRGATTTGRTTTGRTSTSGIGGTSRTSTGQRQYRSNTELGDATIEIDPETRSLIMVTDEDTHLELMKVIKTLDQPKPQVLIKVVFLEVTYNKDSDIGVEGTYTANLRNPTAASTGTRTSSNVTTTQTGSAANPGTTTTTTALTVPLGDAATLGNSATIESIYGLAALPTGNFIRLVSDDWTATLRLLSQKGKTEVLSRPSIMARNSRRNTFPIALRGNASTKRMSLGR